MERVVGTVVRGLRSPIIHRGDNIEEIVVDIAQDVEAKFGTDTIGVVFPILSRNRFAVNLRGIAKHVSSSPFGIASSIRLTQSNLRSAISHSSWWLVAKVFP